MAWLIPTITGIRQHALRLNLSGKKMQLCSSYSSVQGMEGVSWSLLLVRFIISTVLQTHSHVDSVNYHGEDLRQLRQGRNLEGGRSEHMHVCQPVGRQLHLHRAIAIDRWIFVGCIHTCTNRSTYATSWASQSKAGNNSRTVGPHGDLHPPNSLLKQ